MPLIFSLRVTLPQSAEESANTRHDAKSYNKLSLRHCVAGADTLRRCIPNALCCCVRNALTCFPRGCRRSTLLSCLATLCLSGCLGSLCQFCVESCPICVGVGWLREVARQVSAEELCVVQRMSIDDEVEIIAVSEYWHLARQLHALLCDCCVAELRLAV